MIDTDLITKCIANNKEAQYALYKHFYASLMRVALRYTSSKDEAADILNNAFLKIFTKLNTYTFEGSLEGWMRKILVNTALNHLKSEKKYYQQKDINDFQDAFVWQDASSLEAEDLLKMIHSLPSPQKEVFNLFALEGYSHKEIAELLHISEATSKWHLFNARKALQEKVNEQHFALAN